MHRLLIAAAAAAVFAASVAPALADDYPPCKTRDQDHCQQVPMHMMMHHKMMHHPMKHHAMAHHPAPMPPKPN